MGPGAAGGEVPVAPLAAPPPAQDVRRRRPADADALALVPVIRGVQQSDVDEVSRLLAPPRVPLTAGLSARFNGALKWYVDSLAVQVARVALWSGLRVLFYLPLILLWGFILYTICMLIYLAANPELIVSGAMEAVKAGPRYISWAGQRMAGRLGEELMLLMR